MTSRTRSAPRHAGLDAAGVRRIARHRIEKAIAFLEVARPSDRTIHEARKELKKARAMLRLLRDSLPEATYRRENAALRNAARPLGALRDANALLAALDAMSARRGLRASRPGLAGLRRVLRQERDVARRRLQRARTLATERAALRRCAERSMRWDARAGGWKPLGKALERTYRQGREAMKAALSDATVENLHEWRKQAKYLWQELKILRPLWPRLIADLAAETHRLTRYLGEAHDLAALAGKARENRRAFADARAPDALLAAIDRRRARLRGRAFALGGRIYEEKPKAFAARFGEYWLAWKKAGSRT